MERKELVAAATKAGIAKANTIKSVVLTEMLLSMKPKTTERRGRPVDVDSERQKRLAEQAAKRLNGELMRGRPVNEESARQARLKQQAANKELGIGQGRPVNPNSVRQLRLAEQAARAAANGGIAKRGRPAKVETDETAS